MSDLGHYVGKFTHLRRDSVKGWPKTTRGKSPYKPLLLLAILDEFDQGQITHNLIELTSDLGNLFDLYCAVVLPGAIGNIAMPFFHMQGEGFWHKTRNDHPTNGLALCRLCHWSFDEGLMSVATDYRVILSPQLATHGNMPGLLAMLADRPIFLPKEAALYPDPANLDWRNDHIFRKV
jgi:predicted restriction endonuclease